MVLRFVFETSIPSRSFPAICDILADFTSIHLAISEERLTTLEARMPDGSFSLCSVTTGPTLYPMSSPPMLKSRKTVVNLS